jgi:hypothetical protein
MIHPMAQRLLRKQHLPESLKSFREAPWAVTQPCNSGSDKKKTSSPFVASRVHRGVIV